MRKIISLCLLAATLATVLAPVSAEAAYPRMVCKRVWVRGHLVRRCRPAPPPRHYQQRPRPVPYNYNHR